MNDKIILVLLIVFLLALLGEVAARPSIVVRVDLDSTPR